MTRKCPHPDITKCPLYHAMHIADAPSCFSDKLDTGICKVDLGASYDALVAALQIFDMRVIADCEWNNERPRSTLH